MFHTLKFKIAAIILYNSRANQIFLNRKLRIYIQDIQVGINGDYANFPPFHFINLVKTSESFVN